MGRHGGGIVLEGRLIGAAALVILPRIAAAQFTSYVQPQCKVIDSIRNVTIVAQKAKAEAAARIRLTAMKEWVDSVAELPAMVHPAQEPTQKRKPITRPSAPAQPSIGEPILPKAIEREPTAPKPSVGEPIPPRAAPPARPPESSFGEVAPPIAAPPIPYPAEGEAFANGARAPETASSLPLIAATGSLGIVAGLSLLAGTGRRYGRA